MNRLDEYAKAITGALVAGLFALQVAMLDDGATTANESNITGNEWVGVAIAVLTALILVWGVPNKPQTPPE